MNPEPREPRDRHLSSPAKRSTPTSRQGREEETKTAGCVVHAGAHPASRWLAGWLQVAICDLQFAVLRPSVCSAGAGPRRRGQSRQTCGQQPRNPKKKKNLVSRPRHAQRIAAVGTLPGEPGPHCPVPIFHRQHGSNQLAPVGVFSSVFPPICNTRHSNSVERSSPPHPPWSSPRDPPPHPLAVSTTRPPLPAGIRTLYHSTE